MSSYHDLQQAIERAAHAHELQAAREEIDMLRREIDALEKDRLIIADTWRSVRSPRADEEAFWLLHATITRVIIDKS